MKRLPLRCAAPILLAGLAFAGLLRGAQAGARPQVAPLVWPLEAPWTAASSPFGPRWQASQARFDYHPGLDLPAPQDTPVRSVLTGTVAEVGWLSGDAGLSVVVYHPDLDFYSAYLHLHSAPVVVGQEVARGQLIGYAGNSGTTEFYHLHFEIRLTSGNYPTSTRNPMRYLPRPDVTTPVLRLLALNTVPIYSPTVSLSITLPRDELDLNRIRVLLRDRASGAVLDDQTVDFDLRQHTGRDTLDQDGIRLMPGHFNTGTVEYELGALFYRLRGFDSFTLTAQAVDLAGHTRTLEASGLDTTPPERVTSLAAVRAAGGVVLAWVAPGDSGRVGRAARYDVRYAGRPLDALSWGGATVVPNPPTPLAAGLRQVWTLRAALPEPVYFALRTYDDEGNLAPVSNSPRALWVWHLPAVMLSR